MKNIRQCATDDPPAMLRKHRGVIALMKGEIPGLLAIHCLIHKQHLVAWHLSAQLHHSRKHVDKMRQSESSCSQR